MAIKERSPGHGGKELTTATERRPLVQTGPWYRNPVHPWNRLRTVSLIIRLLIGGLFIASGALKLLDPGAFAWNIYQYGLLPRLLIDPLAVGLPVVEVVAGTGLVMNSRWSYGAVLVMLVLFMALLGYALINGLHVDCGCFGPGEPGPAGLRSALLRDVVMLFGLGVSWWFRQERSVQGRTDRQ